MLTGDDMGGQSKASNGRPASAELADDGASVQLNADALHDLGGPINQMRAMADLILKRNRGKLDGDTETMFGFLQASSDRLENLLSGLRTHVAGTPGDHEHAALCPRPNDCAPVGFRGSDDGAPWAFLPQGGEMNLRAVIRDEDGPWRDDVSLME